MEQVSQDGGNGMSAGLPPDFSLDTAVLGTVAAPEIIAKASTPPSVVNLSCQFYVCPSYCERDCPKYTYSPPHCPGHSDCHDCPRM